MNLNKTERVITVLAGVATVIGLPFTIFGPSAVLEWLNDETHILLVCIGIVFAFCILVVVCRESKPRGEQDQSKKPFASILKKPLKPDWQNYTKTKFFGAHWSWQYKGNTLDSDSFIAFCPRQGCENRLEPGIDLANPDNPPFGFGGIFQDPVTLTCHRCGYKKHFEYDYRTLVRRVADEIERRVRTGEYRQEL